MTTEPVLIAVGYTLTNLTSQNSDECDGTGKVGVFGVVSEDGC